MDDQLHITSTRNRTDYRRPIWSNHIRQTTQIIPLSEWKRNTYRIHILLRILHILLCILPTARHPAAVTRKSYPPPTKNFRGGFQ